VNEYYIHLGEERGGGDWCNFGCNELPLQCNDARHFWQIETPLEIYQIPIRYLYIPAAYYKKVKKKKGKSSSTAENAHYAHNTNATHMLS
jgi:hypothetical protein